jgi:hypothetical protein
MALAHEQYLAGHRTPADCRCPTADCSGADNLALLLFSSSQDQGQEQAHNGEGQGKHQSVQSHSYAGSFLGSFMPHESATA